VLLLQKRRKGVTANSVQHCNCAKGIHVEVEENGLTKNCKGKAISEVWSTTLRKFGAPHSRLFGVLLENFDAHRSGGLEHTTRHSRRTQVGMFGTNHSISSVHIMNITLDLSRTNREVWWTLQSTRETSIHHHPGGLIHISPKIWRTPLRIIGKFAKIAKAPNNVE